jgi:hypothetical protein
VIIRKCYAQLYLVSSIDYFLKILGHHLMKEEEFNSFDLIELTDDNLMKIRVQLDAELTRRGLNFSVGEIGEKVAIEYFNATPGLSNLIEAPTGAKNIDALSRDGDRYSIKTQMKAKKSGTIYPDTEFPDKQLFEYLLIVKLSPDYQLETMHRFTWDMFLQARAWDKRMNAWYIPVSNKRLDIAEKIYSKNI